MGVRTAIRVFFTSFIEFVMSAFNRDYPLILGLVAFYASIVVLFNLFVDLAIAWLNPRTRTRSAA